MGTAKTRRKFNHKGHEGHEGELKKPLLAAGTLLRVEKALTTKAAREAQTRKENLTTKDTKDTKGNCKEAVNSL